MHDLWKRLLKKGIKLMFLAVVHKTYTQECYKENFLVISIGADVVIAALLGDIAGI